MFVSIQIKSKNKNSLKHYLKLLVKLFSIKKLKLQSILRCFNQKSQRQIFTVLKSPHVNKTSQEQLEYNLKSKQLDLDSLQVFKFLTVLKKIEKVNGFDVSVVIKFMIQDQSSKFFFLQRVIPENYKLKFYNDLKSTRKYLKLLELHGNLMV